jgi:tRNA pseudouridine55 synthase
VGHGGTLDPNATGLLVVAIGRDDTSKLGYISKNTTKIYLAEIMLGEKRDTDDIEGKVEESSTARPNTSEIIAILPQFVGKIKQTPSRFSAIKIDGQRAYDLARQNIAFEMKMREIEIFSLKLLQNNNEFCEIEVECSKGTYVRTLARDICKKLAVCGYVCQLRRLKVGKFCYQDKISLEKLKNIITFGGAVCDGSLLLLQDVL